MRDDRGAVEAEGSDHGADVGGLGLVVVAGGGMRRTSDAAQVRDDDGVGLHEFGGEGSPGVAGFGVSVDEDYDRALAAGADVDVCASGAVDGLGFEGGGQRGLWRGDRCGGCRKGEEDESGCQPAWVAPHGLTSPSGSPGCVPL